MSAKARALLEVKSRIAEAKAQLELLQEKLQALEQMSDAEYCQNLVQKLNVPKTRTASKEEKKKLFKLLKEGLKPLSQSAGTHCAEEQFELNDSKIRVLTPIGAQRIEDINYKQWDKESLVEVFIK